MTKCPNIRGKFTQAKAVTCSPEKDGYQMLKWAVKGLNKKVNAALKAFYASAGTKRKRFLEKETTDATALFFAAHKDAGKGRNCKGVRDAVNTMVADADFDCSVVTTTAVVTTIQPGMLTCAAHQDAALATKVLSVDGDECAAKATSLNTILTSCGMPSKIKNAFVCSANADQNNLKMLVAESIVDGKVINKFLNNALTDFDSEAPSVRFNEAESKLAFAPNQRKCSDVTTALNSILAQSFTCEG